MDTAAIDRMVAEAARSAGAVSQLVYPPGQLGQMAATKSEARARGDEDVFRVRRVANGYVVSHQRTNMHSMMCDAPQEYVCLADNLLDCVKEAVVASVLSA